MVDFFSKKVDFILAVFICLLSFPDIALSQAGAEEYMVINRLSRENGLPDQDINGIYFDDRGYAWISTFGGGLVRYDGDSFITFSSKNYPEILEDIVRQCREDQFDRLWVPAAGGVEILDMKTHTFMGDFPGMSKEWRHSHYPAALRRDTKGGIWFTSGDHLYRVGFSDDGSRFIVDSLKCDVPNENYMPKVGDVENDGSVWISLNGHLFKVRQIEGKGLCLSEIFPDIYIGEENRATAFLRTGNDVWIGTMDGLYRVDMISGRHTLFKHSESDIHSLSNNEISGLCLSSDGEIVVGTLGGVCIYDPDNNSFDTYGSHPNVYGNKTLPGNIVRSIATKGRQIWVGLEAEGLVVLQKKSLNITNLSSLETTTSIIPSTPVRSIYIDSNNTMWLATTGFGLCRQSGDLVFRNYNTDNSSILSNSITAFCEDGQGRIWMGSVNGQMNYINLSDPDVVRIPAGNKSETARSIDAILGLAYDSVNNYIWIAALSGLFIYDLDNSTFIRSSIRESSCLSLCIVSEKMWVSSLEGASIVDLKTMESREISDYPVCISLVSDGETIWCGTFGNGLYKVENWMEDDLQITVYSEDNGLADNQINGLLSDGIYLWITTENGLSCLDTQTGKINSYTMWDGLKSMAFCENSIVKGKNGSIYMGLKGGGLSILRSSYIADESFNTPDISISGYYSKGQFSNLSHCDTINKTEKDTDFTLKFSDLSYSKGSNIIYESRLYPLDKDWVPVFGNDKLVTPGHIPGGKYQIQIRAVDKKGNVLSQDERILNVKPILYKRWWFRILVLILLALIVRYFWMWSNKSAETTKEFLRQEVEKQTQILNDQKKELERRAKELSEQNALLQRQNEMIASHNTLSQCASSNEDSHFATDLLDTIQKMYKDPELDVHALAEAMGMSRSTLNEKIQKVLGQSIAQFIRTYRLNVAKEIICNGTNKDMTISEIAYDVGFNDPKYFTRCFAKEFNVSPSNMHKQNK